MVILKILKIIPIIIFVLTIFSGAHYFVHFSATRFFGIASGKIRIILFLAITIFSVSFFISAFLVRLKENFLTSAIYFLSGFWLGLLLNLFMAAAASWLIFGLFKLTGYRPNTIILASIFFGLALAFSIYGVFKAFNPRVKNIEITIKNLPPAWQGKTVVQLSDIHLGVVHKKAFLQKIIDRTNTLNPDIIFITGDLFDGTDGDLNSAIEPLNNLKAKNGIYFITGNHEIYLGLQKTFNFLKQTPVKILNDEIVNINGLQIIGLSYSEQISGFNMGNRDIKNIVLSKNNFIKGAPTILLNHAPFGVKEAQELGVNLELSGHTHDGQLFPLNIINNLIWRGNSYGLHQSGDFSIYATSGLGTWGPPMRTTSPPEIVAIKLK